MARIEAVHLDQKLVQRLLLFVVAAHRICAACAPERVELIDEDDRRRALARLLEQVAHARRADADKHLDELRAVDREEGHASLARNRARQQRFAGTRRPHQQHTFRNAPAETVEAHGILEKADDLAQLLLCLIDAGDVGKRRLRIGFDVDLRAALADRQEAAAHAALLRHSPHEEHPQQIEHERRQHP